MTEDFEEFKEDYAQHARELLAHMEQGNHGEAERILDEITRLREKSLFQELGKLTREFHEALNSFRLDSRIANLAENEIPDARERLNYVIAMTEQAADRTLTAVEESLPLCDRITAQAEALKGQWERFVRREMEADEFRAMSHELREFLAEVTDGNGKVKASLNDVLMAQDFQDLTGQIIRRVITLVEDLEGSLVDLIRLSSQGLMPGKAEQPVAEGHEDKERDIEAAGPVVPGVEHGETVSGQDEVDDLLSSLGF